MAKITRNKSLTIKDTLDGSRKQHEFYKDKWKPLNPDNSIYKSLWLFVEIGEAVDLIKKERNKISKKGSVRKEFTREIVDCYMYLADILNCFGITTEEISTAYFEKLNFNLKNPRKYWKKNKKK